MAYDLSLREKRLIQAAGVLIILFLLYLLFLRGGSEPLEPPVPVAQPEPQAMPQTMPMPPAAVATPPPAPLADISGLRLHGLLASGAVIGFPSGRQRLVPVGREALPGLTLRRIEQNLAVFDSAGGELRLGFDGPVAAAPGAPAPAPLTSSAEGAQREEALRYRLGLEPRRAGGRVTGFAVRANVEMPALARAGIRPGDVIVAINGSAFDEERMQELAWQIANSTRLDFEVERGGQRLRLSLPRR